MVILQTILMAADEPSKVPFYIIGSILAVAAVAVSFVGLSNPTFPGGERGARPIMLLFGVLFVATVAAAIATSK
jgi:hypothetical protein